MAQTPNTSHLVTTNHMIRADGSSPERPSGDERIHWLAYSMSDKVLVVEAPSAWLAWPGVSQTEFEWLRAAPDPERWIHDNLNAQGKYPQKAWRRNSGDTFELVSPATIHALPRDSLVWRRGGASRFRAVAHDSNASQLWLLHENLTVTIYHNVPAGQAAAVLARHRAGKPTSASFGGSPKPFRSQQFSVHQVDLGQAISGAESLSAPTSCRKPVVLRYHHRPLLHWR